MAIPRLNEPPGKPEPYIIPPYAGEAITIPGTKSVVRILASAKETDRLISVFRMDGVTGDPVGFHYHEHAHDVFMCTKGRMKVSIDDQCRILGPGDFAYAPPTVIHSPQLVDPIVETIGLVTPGDWVDFFRFISEKYDGNFTPEFDNRNTMQFMFPKFQEIKAKYDVHFVPHHKGADVQEWSEADSKIPPGKQFYYLKANTGPRYLLGGVLSRPFITTKQCDGQFAVASIESSSTYGDSVLSKPFSFAKVHQVYCILDGSITVTIDGKDNIVASGETVFIPAGTKISIKFNDRYVRFWSYSSGDALETLVSEAGGPCDNVIIPDEPRDVDAGKVAETAKSIGMTI